VYQFFPRNCKISSCVLLRHLPSRFQIACDIRASFDGFLQLLQVLRERILIARVKSALVLEPAVMLNVSAYLDRPNSSVIVERLEDGKVGVRDILAEQVWALRVDIIVVRPNLMEFGDRVVLIRVRGVSDLWDPRCLKRGKRFSDACFGTAREQRGSPASHCRCLRSRRRTASTRRSARHTFPVHGPGIAE
jgi:hypothetical protein